MIEFNPEEVRVLNRRSSKGNQMKFERDGIWYKADYLGYEGLAEFVISRLLAFSTLSPDEFAEYALEQITYNGNIYNGCSSRDFTGGWQLITIERLLTQNIGAGANQIVYGIPDHTERLRTLVQQVERLTGIRDFGIYMSKMLAVDTFFLNEDRHSHNIAVLTNDRKEYRLAPIFDNAAGLLSDTMMDYPMNQDIRRLIERAKPKTFCDDFEEQLDIVNNLYGEQLRFSFGYNDVQAILDEAQIYSAEIRQRVLDIVMSRRNTYGYMFRQMNIG